MSGTVEMELIEQYELQIHAAQLESQKRRLQIEYAQRQIDEYLSKQDHTKKKLSDVNKVHSSDYYTQQRQKRDLAYADREVVRSVLLRELGGETYVPPAISSGELNIEDSSETSSSSSSNHCIPGIILIRTGDKTHPEISFHCTLKYRFIDLLKDTCNFYGVPLDDFELIDSNGIKWEGKLSIVEQYVFQFKHNLQPIMYLVSREQLDVGRIYNWRHPKPAYLTESDAAKEIAAKQATLREQGSAASVVPQRIQRVMKQM
jgi:hypothetical protein